MTGKSNMAEDKGYSEEYSPTKNKEDWSFTDVEGNAPAKINELFPVIRVQAGHKTIEIYHEELGTLWSVRFAEGGQLPASLTGKFTSDADAKLAVDLYVASLNQE